MFLNLKDFTTILTGYTFRGAIKPAQNGNTFVFQAKDLVQGEPVSDLSSLTKITHDSSHSNYSGYLQQHDVLIVARGMRGAFRSTVYHANANNVMASSSIHIIRIKTKNVLPEFLAHYFNSTAGQNSLAHAVTGTYMMALPRKKLEQIKIPVPTLQKQQALIRLHHNLKEQQNIVKRLIAIKQDFLNAAFTNLIIG